MRISFQRLRDMVGWLIKGCTIVPLRKSAIYFEDFCVFCIGKLGGLPGSSAALLVTNCCHAVFKLPALVSDQLFCHQSRQMLPSYKRCNFGNSFSGWFEMQKSLMFCRLYWQRIRLTPVLIILWFDTMHNGSVVN